MRRVKIFVTDVREGDQVSRTREGQVAEVISVRKIRWDTVEIGTTGWGKEFDFARMIWMEVD